MHLKMRSEAILIACLSATLSAVPAANAQSSADDKRNLETRADLQEQLRLATLKQNAADAYIIRYRLAHGDFHPGDRIILHVVRGSLAVADTLVVRDDNKLYLPQMGDLSLEGVLRSELVPLLNDRVAKFVRDPVIEAKMLVRIGILGMVNRPGFYYAPPDLPLTDVLMAAGGPNGSADLSRVTVRRDGDVIIDANNTRTALSSGMSMDFLHMQAGDEIMVGREKDIPWNVIVPATSAVLGILVAYLSRH
jgi:protein involved in polysaccharide export with SLBB domain